MFFQGCASRNRMRMNIGCGLSRPRPTAFFLDFLGLLLLIVLSAAVAAASETLYLRVVLNGEVRGDFLVMQADDGDYLMRPEDFGSLPLAQPPGKPRVVDGEQYVSLRSVPGLSLAFDEKSLTLVLTAPVTAGLRVIDFSPQPGQRSTAYYPRERSGFLNYGLTYSFGNSGSDSLTATEKAGLRTGEVLFLTDGQYTKTDGGGDFVRLMTSATYERRSDFQRFVAGDLFASSGDLGSTITIGGLGFMKAYQMDPYFIKQPTFGLSGAASAASQVEVYVDGLLVSRQTVQPGEFELKNLNYYGGDRSVEVIIRDPYGNIQRITAPVYFSDLLLKKSLHEYSYNAGFLREEYGERSNRYGPAAFSAFHRYGLSDNVNLGFMAEGTRGVTEAGIQTAVLFPRFGVLTAQAAGSAGDFGRGGAASIAHTFQKGFFGSTVLFRGLSREHRTISTLDDEDTTRYEASTLFNFSTNHYGSFGLGYSATRQYSGSYDRLGSTTYSKNLTRNLVLLFTGQAVKESGEDAHFDFFLTLNYMPDRDRLVSAQYQHTADGDSETIQVQKNVPLGEGYGYRANATSSDSDSSTTKTLNPFFQYNGRYGVYSVDSSLSLTEGTYSHATSLTAAGSVVAAGGFAGFSRPVNDSFGIVMVEGLPDVKATLNNQNMGRTNRWGRLVIPNMSSYQFNQVSVDAANISMNYSLTGVNATISPAQWSGACVSFHAKQARSVTGMLYIKRGGEREPAEFGEIRLSVNGREARFPTGKGGEFYIENSLPQEQAMDGLDPRSCRAALEQRNGKSGMVSGTYPAKIDYHGATCSFSILFPETEDPISDLGEITCIVTEKGPAPL